MFMSVSQSRSMEGGNYIVGGKEFNVSGALNANLPGENLMASMRADIGLPAQKLRKSDTDINIDMFQGKIKELNDRDIKAGLDYQDVDDEFDKFQTAYLKRKGDLEKQINDKTEELARLELDITGTYGSGVTYEDDIVPMNVKKRVDDLQEDIFDLESKVESDRDWETLGRWETNHGGS